ncbi:MAG: hypothetical protein GTO02_10715 [Candidatus Dadabacteria bacterium]|nr:hypothetical protein [Candidatus Dadabacteria bacterium]NIQ14837.1 hypothetical protein [Candidatus Dadabacteria bacterium]
MLIRYIRVAVKALIFLILLFGFLFTTSLNNLFIRKTKPRLIISSKLSSFFSKLTLFVLGFDVRSQAFNVERKNSENFLIVSNHLSYMDTFILASQLNCIFIAAKDGVQEQFPLGWVTKNSGGIFIERKIRSNIRAEINKIKNILNDGFNVVLFPEGTTSDGVEMLKFRSPFFSSVFNSNINILPVCICYKKLNGDPISEDNINLISYSGKIGFFEHFFRMLSFKNIEVLITFLDIIESKSFKSRKELTNSTYNKIYEFYKTES